MLHRRATGLNTLISDAGNSLAKLNALDGFSRSILVGIVPLLALQALGTKEAVTKAYLLGSVLTLMITLNYSTLEHVIQRRWVLTLGGSFVVMASCILYLSTGLEFAIGIGLRSASASLFSVCLSLYIMDYIGKRDLTQVESRRMVYNGVAWLTGPSLGIWMWNTLPPWTPFLLTSVAGCTMLMYFWRLRLGPNPVIKKAQPPSTNPFKLIPRYFQQSSLCIAYLITISRSIFWVTLFVYGPIYAVEAGMPNWVAGGLLSFTSGLLFLSPLIRKLANRIGIRKTIMAGQVLAGSSMIGLFVIGEPAVTGLIYWSLAALGGVLLDVVGNIPFMRMVKPRERTEMTMIFSTWREGSELLTPLIAATILAFTVFHVYYLFLGSLLIVAAIVSAWLPRRL